MLPRFLQDILSDLFLRYKRLWARIGITDKATWILYQYLIFASSFFLAFSLYFVFYRSIPTVSQSSKLYLYKTDTGYYSRVFNSEGNFPICRKSSIIGSPTASESEMLIQKTCANPVDLGTCELEFGEETYEIILKFALPETAQNLKYGEAVPVFGEFISQSNAILTVNAEGIPTHERFSLSKIIKGVTNTLGLTSGDLMMEVILSEKFVNSLFDVNVINIEIRHPNVVIRNGVIETRVILGGIRGIMYRWFWTSMVFIVGFLTICLFIGINVVWSMSKKVKAMLLGNPDAVARGKKDKRVVEQKKDQDIMFKRQRENSPKKSMDSFLQKLD